MATFLTGHELNTELGKIFESAEEKLILISPYIKLHDRFASALRTKLKNHKLQIVIVFGKNENDVTRSMKQEDFNFFKEFPNIEIRYEKRLHAKYYANESVAILTSMNLYSYSQDNNIEAGIRTDATVLGNLANQIWDGKEDLDTTTGKYFERVIEQADLLFSKKPQYESAMMGLSKKYMQSEIIIDKLTDFFTGKHNSNATPPKLKNLKIETAPSNETNSKSARTAYCIRTGTPIPFNEKHPMSDVAYQSWSKYKNKEFPEKFCHFTGEPSHGKTTFSKPILHKNWNKAKEEHRF